MAFTADNEYRNELKYYINNSDVWALKNRLRFVMKKDVHIAKGGRYQIRSLYFDSDDDRILIEKYDGVSDREKYRIRLYNGDDTFIRLEKKIKHNGLTGKLGCPLSRAETEAIIKGDVEWMKKVDDRPLVTELFYAVRGKGLYPKTIVDYTREPYIYPYGNVRVTVDSDVRSGLGSVDIFDDKLPTVPVLEVGKSILEIKYDAYLPDIIRALVQINDTTRTQASKYAACRLFL